MVGSWTAFFAIARRLQSRWSEWPQIPIFSNGTSHFKGVSDEV